MSRNEFRHWWEGFKFATVFITALLAYWVLHVLVIGWFYYLFKPRTYLIRAGDILSDLDCDGQQHENTHWLWWNRHNCKAGRIAAVANDSDALVRFTLRTHPFFLSSDILYVYSPGYKARVFNEDVKVYS